MNNLPNINFKKTSKNPTIDSDNGIYELPFYKDAEFFSNLDNFVSFVKSVEKMVRSSNQYSRYIAYLKTDVGLTCCQVLSNIIEEDEKDNLIEMHHGPILTLFDYAAIITDYLIYNKRKINTFIVSDILLEEHFNNNIQVVMLSKTVHQQVHDNNIFINLHQAFGDLNRFLKKYKNGLHQEQVSKINSYIELSEKYDSFDKNVLQLKDNIIKWSNHLDI